MDGWMDGWMNRWMDRWMDEWMNGWMGGWMQYKAPGYLHLQSNCTPIQTYVILTNFFFLEANQLLFSTAIFNSLLLKLL